MNNAQKRNSRFSAWFGTAIIILFGFSALSAQGKTVVHISRETSVNNDRISLGDIANVSGGTESVDRLKRISLGYSPGIDMTREITREQIALTIAAAGFSENDVTLDAPPKAIVHRSGQSVLPEKIREAVERSIHDQLSANDISIQLVKFDLPGNIRVPIGNVEVRVGSGGASDLFTAFSLPVDIYVDGKKYRGFPLTVEIEAFADVFVAAKDLAVNAKLSEAFVQTEKRRILKPITNYLRDAEQLRGMRLIRNLAKGSEITTDSCVPGTVINSGDPVRMEGQSGNVKIILLGEARTSGKIGDKITVKNSQSGKVLQALVIDEGLVQVIF